MVMNFSSFFLVSEFLEFGVVCCKSFWCPSSALQSFLIGLQFRFKNLSSFASLLLLDIIQVWVAKEENNSKKEQRVAIRSVIKGVWLIPIWERSNIAMGQWCTISLLEFSLSICVLWRDVVVGIICTSKWVREHELEVVSWSSNNCLVSEVHTTSHKRRAEFILIHFNN